VNCAQCKTALEQADFDFHHRVGTCPHCGAHVREGETSEKSGSNARRLTPLHPGTPAHWTERVGDSGSVELRIAADPIVARRIGLFVSAIVLAGFGAFAVRRSDAACVAFFGLALGCAILAMRLRRNAEIVVRVRADAFAWRGAEGAFEESPRSIASFGVFHEPRREDDEGKHGVEAHVRDTTVRLPITLDRKDATALAARMNGLLEATREVAVSAIAKP
jgi:hypothetical protein